MSKVLVATELRFERLYLLLSVPIGLGPKNSEVRVADGALHVKMGWAFDAHIPLASITKAEAPTELAFTWGGHYSRGRWLVKTTPAPERRFLTSRRRGRSWINSLVRGRDCWCRRAP